MRTVNEEIGPLKRNVRDFDEDARYDPLPCGDVVANILTT
jgi:hypothetical protein